MTTGRQWAYRGIIIGGVASVVGNVASTILKESDVALYLRVPWAVLWPVCLYVGIEVLTRTPWRRGFLHWITRVVLVGPVSGVAAFVSYLHLHHLMRLSTEPGLAQALGPLAIDGLLFGCTVVLLITRPQDTEVPAVPPAVPAVLEVPDLEDTVSLPVPAAVPPVLAVPDPPPLVSSRVPAWDPVKVLALINEGHGDHDVSSLAGVSSKTVQRVRRAHNLLTKDPNAVVPAAWKVPAAAVLAIREEVSR